MSLASAAEDADEQEAAREYADELAAAAGRAWAAAHPDGKGWAACKCGTPNCWAEVTGGLPDVALARSRNGV